MTLKSLLITLCVSTACFGAQPHSFSYQGQIINPACLAVFNISMNDKPWIQSVSIEGCQHSNATNKAIKTDSQGRYYFYKNNQDPNNGTYAYEYIGETPNGVYIVHTYNGNKNNKQIIDDILFLRIKPHIIYQYKANNMPYKDKTPMLSLIGYVSGGNRCSGGIKSTQLQGNLLKLVTYYDHQEPNDCTGTRTFNVDLSVL